MHISFRADKTISAYMYINIKIDSLNPHSDLDLSHRNQSLFLTHHTSMVILYIKEKLKSFLAY
jgi:hypothetical protein